MKIMQVEGEKMVNHAWYIPVCNRIESNQSASAFSILIEIPNGKHLKPKNGLVKAQERLPKFLRWFGLYPCIQVFQCSILANKIRDQLDTYWKTRRQCSGSHISRSRRLCEMPRHESYKNTIERPISAMRDQTIPRLGTERLGPFTDQVMCSPQDESLDGQTVKCVRVKLEAQDNFDSQKQHGFQRKEPSRIVLGKDEVHDIQNE